jgi:hypothetical protein
MKRACSSSSIATIPSGPSYSSEPLPSPDFSPIEETFSKLKAYLRRAGARTREELQEAIGQALLTVTAQDAQGWFRHCGYLPAQGRV